jgi:predicted flap endonuclease-1-like 5' DNA nuclease
MAWLFSQMFPYLLIALLLGGIIGWCWHCIRKFPVYQALVADREYARDEFMRIAATRVGVAADSNDPAISATLTQLRQDREGLTVQLNDREARLRELQLRLDGLSSEAGDRDGHVQGLNARIEALTVEAAHAKTLRAELERLRAEQQEAPSANAVAFAATPPTAPQGDLWRQRYLESRVRYLEGKLSDTAASEAKLESLERDLVSARAANARVAQLEAELSNAKVDDPRIAMLQEELDEARSWRGMAEDLDRELAETRAKLDDSQHQLSQIEARPAQTFAETEELERVRWQNRSLQQRIEELETRPVAPPAPSYPDLRSDLIDARARIEDLEARTIPEGPSEYEFAKANWRIKYLESRVEYLSSRGGAGAAVQGFVSSADPADVDEASDDVDQDGGVRPPALSSPRDTQKQDDLKEISGIGPKIEGTLHGLGIFHFDQIASWTPANVAWVEQYLQFKGRIGREAWVKQAGQLAAGIETEGARKYRSGEHT